MNDHSAAKRRRRDSTLSRVLVAIGSIIAVFLLVVFLDTGLYYGKVHAGVHVSGVGLGGLTRDEAVGRLNTLVEDSQDNGVILSSGDRTWVVMPADVGVQMNVAAAVTAAMEVTRESNFLIDLGRRLKLYFSDVDLPLTGTVDSAMMNEAVADLARQIDTAPQNAGLAVEGSRIEVIEGQDGRAVDQEALRARLEALLLTLHATELEIPLVVVPAVRAEDNRAAQEQAEMMTSAPVILVDDDETWSLGPQQIAAAMDFRAEFRDGVPTLVPYLSAVRLSSFFDQIAGDVAEEAVDATFDSDGDKAWVIPGTPGRELDRPKTAEALTSAALSPGERTASVSVRATEPELTTEEAEARGIRDLLASYTTPPYAGTSNRQINVRITTEYASDVMLAPGQMYDFDEQIGPRTSERGYRLAPGIVGPGKLEDVFGGGICQVSTTLFNAVFFAGLEVVERHNHSIYIDHYPKGRDATVTAGGKNLRFKNDTDHWIWIRGISDGITTTFNIYGTDDGREVSHTTSDFYNWVGRTTVTSLNPALSPGASVVEISGQSGKQVTVVRTVTLPDGTVLHKDKFVSTFPMIPRLIEVGPTVTTTTTPPVTTTTTLPSTTSTTGTTTSGTPSTG